MGIYILRQRWWKKSENGRAYLLTFPQKVNETENGATEGGRIGDKRKKLEDSVYGWSIRDHP